MIKMAFTKLCSYSSFIKNFQMFYTDLSSDFLLKLQLPICAFLDFVECKAACNRVIVAK